MIKELLDQITHPLRDRLLHLKCAHPATPLQDLPAPVRNEVTQILASALNAASAPKHQQTAVPQEISPNGHANGTHPQPKQSDEASCETVLGTDSQTGREVTISQKAREQGMNCPGVNGAGKTTLFLNMIDSDIRAGRGVAVFDPHGDLVKNILASMPAERLPDVILLDVTDADFPIGLNLFETPLPGTIRTKAATASFLAHVFAKVWGAGTETPRLMMVLRAVTRTLIDNPGATMAEIPLLLSSDTIRSHMVSQLTNQEIVLFWENYNRRSQREKDELTASTSNKIAAFLDEPMIRHIVGQSKSTLDFRRIMDEGKILLVSLSPQFEEASSLLGAVIIGRLLLAAFSRVDTPENLRRPFYLFADEWHRYATSDFATLLAEARKFRLATILANQTLELLDDANRAAALQAGSLVCFRVSGEDSQVYAKSYDATPPPQQEQTGWEPIRAPVADVLGHLLHKGHINPLVSEFTEYVKNLDSLLKRYPMPNLPLEFGCCRLPPVYVDYAKSSLNKTLHECMVTGRSNLRIEPLVLLLLGGATDDEITYIFQAHMRYSEQCFDGLQETANYLGHPSFLTKEPALTKFLEKYGKISRWFSQKTLTPGPKFIRMLKALRQTMEILSKEPVLTDTGQYRPIYRTRLYADVSGQIANTLSQLPNYHAKVRLLSGEHTIITKPPPRLVSEREGEKRIAAIKQRMLFSGYARPYREVEREIELRQQSLRERAAADTAPPPIHTNGNRRRRGKPSPANT